VDFFAGFAKKILSKIQNVHLLTSAFQLTALQLTAVQQLALLLASKLTCHHTQPVHHNTITTTPSPITTTPQPTHNINT
jgi:hypothetical protein